MTASFQSVNPPPRVPRETFEAVIWSGVAICTLALAFRCYIRIRVFRRLQPDDFITIFAWALLLATALIWNFTLDGLYELALVSSGSKLPSKNFVMLSERYLKGTIAVIFMFYLGLWTIKMNFLVLFYRLGSQITPFRVAWWTVTIFTVCVGISTFGTIHYVCLASPMAYIQEHCRQPAAIRFQSVTLKLNCAWDVFTDALIVLFPISILHNVRIGLGRKFALGAVFSLVVITMTVAIIRVTVVGNHNTGRQIEMTWLYLWCFIELSVALLVACLASFRTLFAQQERVAEAKEAEERERAERAAVGVAKSKAQWARLKYLGNSLLQSTRDDKTQKTAESFELPLQKQDSGSIRISEQTHDSIDFVPQLNTHNIVLHDEVRV